MKNHSNTVGRRHFLGIVAAAACGMDPSLRALADHARSQSSTDSAISDPLIAALDLSRPEMSSVAVAAAKGDIVGARSAFAVYLRTRTKPVWFEDPAAPSKKADSETIATANRALKHTFVSVGIPYTFPGTIDWSFNVTTQPGSQYAANYEWTWQLNRMPEWIAMAQAYSATSDSRYATELGSQIVD